VAGTFFTWLAPFLTESTCLWYDNRLTRWVRWQTSWYASFLWQLLVVAASEAFGLASAELDEPYLLDEAVVDRFRADGFARLPNVLSAETLGEFVPEIDRLVDERNSLANIPLEERTLYDKAFIQVCSLWRESERVRELAFSKRLARIAAELMGVRGVRTWHDQSLYKEPSGGVTPWHVDQQYWPMASSMIMTAWIPLQAVPDEMGPLLFGRGSHRKRIGRELEISGESEQQISAAVNRETIAEVQEPYALGDVSFHLGWTLHRAGPNLSSSCRRVFNIIYMDMEMRMAQPKYQNQQDWDKWTPSTKLGEVMDDPLNPVLYCSS
jgi:ectoine hydroxylase-related dioxygenase (phytanoyl-CoA dioxygenase family)